MAPEDARAPRRSPDEAEQDTKETVLRDGSVGTVTCMSRSKRPPGRHTTLPSLARGELMGGPCGMARGHRVVRGVIEVDHTVCRPCICIFFFYPVIRNCGGTYTRRRL